jgi:hypothetical protein
MLPHPRGHQHDQDPGRRTGAEKRADARRRQRQETGSRATGSGRDKSGADWSAGDWGGVSDEQYWAELSADKPLATTARSAPAGGAHPEAAAGAAEGDEDPADTSGRRARLVDRSVQPPFRVRAARPAGCRAGGFGGATRAARFRWPGR